nr:threonine--tRNA ligase [Rhodococcus wratislaviensis]
MINSDHPDHDHRVINSEMGLFATDPLVGAGLPLWLPAGAIIRRELEQFAYEVARRDGCVSVYSPVLAKRALYERSGHWAKFSDDMFPPMPISGDDLVLRPANCPHHAMIFAAQQHSYRDLPLRLHELAPMFRAERSGVLSGLSRVRQITLDDTHVFCRPDQIADEITRALRSALDAHRLLGTKIDAIRLSCRDDSPTYIGTPADWLGWEDALRSAATQVAPDYQLPVVEAPGEAAFYGPKLDLQVHDDNGNDDTIATVQLDANQPRRFDLTYTAADGSHQHPVMIHRGTIGSMERVTATLIERHRGRLPLWLAPIQVCALPISDSQDTATDNFTTQLTAAGIRCYTDRHGSLSARIRASRQRRDTIIAIIGPREASETTVQVNEPATGYRNTHTTAATTTALLDAYRRRNSHISWPHHR